MASKNLQRAYNIYKLILAGGDRQPSENDITFLRKFRKKHGDEFDAYVKQQNALKKVASTDFSGAKSKMLESHAIRTSLPKPESSNPEGSKETQKTGQLIKQNTRAIKINNAAWRGIDAAIKDGAIDGTKVKELEAKGKQKEAYELGVKLVRDYLKDANKILGDGEKLQVDGIYGRKSKAAFTKYNEYKQAFAGDNESANPLLKEGTTGDRFQMRRAYSYNSGSENLKTHSDTLRARQNDNGYQSLDSIRNNPEFLAGLTIDSTARFNRDNAYIFPDIGAEPDSIVSTPRGQRINYTGGTSYMPEDTIPSRHPMIIGEESYDPYLDVYYTGRRGSMLYTPIWENEKLRTDTMGIRGIRGEGTPLDTYELYPVDTIPGLYSDERLPYSATAYAYYNASPILNQKDSSYVHPDTMIAHPELLEQARLASEAMAALDTLRPIYLNFQRKGGLLKKRCKK